MPDDGGDAGKGFHVVYQGGHVPQAVSGGVGRAGARLAAFAFNRLDQRGFFAADIGTSTGVDVNFEVKLRAKNTLTQNTQLVGLVDGGLQASLRQGVFAANVDVALGRADGITGDRHGFDNVVWIAFQHQTVFEGAWLALVRVADDILLLAGRFGHKAPLQPGREASAAAAFQPRLLDFINYLGRGHFTQHFTQRRIAVMNDVSFNVGWVDQPHPLQHNALLGWQRAFARRKPSHTPAQLAERGLEACCDASLIQMFFNQEVHVFGLYRPIYHRFRVDNNHWDRIMAANIADHRKVDFILQTKSGDFFLQLLEYLLGAVFHAGRVAGYQNH